MLLDVYYNTIIIEVQRCTDCFINSIKKGKIFLMSLNEQIK